MLRSLWRHFRPGLLAALALVLIVGGCLAISSTGGASGGGTAPGYTAAPAVGALSPPPQPNTPTWVGTVRVTQDGITMDTQPPAATKVVGGDAAVQFDGANLVVFGSSAGIWTAPSDPSYEQCLGLVQTQPVTSGTTLGYSPGRGVCVLTAQRTAMGFLRGSGNPDSGGVQMRVIRWTVP